MSYSRSTAPRWRGLLCAGIAGVIAMGAGAFWYVHATMTTTPLGHTANDGSDVGIMLGLADGAYQDKRLVAPIGSNVYEFYSSVLQLDPHNAMAEKRLRESFEPACAVIEHALNDGDLDEAQRELRLLRDYDAHNYRLALLGGVLDAQLIIQARRHEAEAARIRAQQAAQ